MECPNCRARMGDGIHFCMSCGTYVAPARTTRSAMPMMAQSYVPTALARRDLQPGSLILRLLAYLLDTALLATVLLPLFAVYAFTHGESLDAATVRAAASVLGLPALAIEAAYFIAFERSAWMATPGKRLLGLAVTDEDGDRIGAFHAAGRFLFKTLLGTFIPIAVLVAVVTPKKQAMHDILAGTVVTER